MEKDVATEPQPLGRPNTMDEGVRSAKPSSRHSVHSLRRHESDGASDASSDLENQNHAQAPQDLGLSRTVSSGPPYTIYNHTTKMFILASVSVSSLISPFGATTFYPALNTLANQLNVTPTMVNLSLTTYMIAQAVAPSILAGMSDSSGRRPSFLICFVIFICANIGLALQTNYAALLVLRMVQATGCSAAIALTNAVVADIATSAERGKYMGYATAGLLIGPAFGPTIGGLLAEYLGWRAIFWFLAIFTGVLLAVFGAFFPETGRNVVGNGSIPAQGWNQSILGYLQQRKHMRESGSMADDKSSIGPPRKQKVRMVNPLKTLAILKDKLSCLILIYNGFFFTGMMTTTSAVPELYNQAYGYNELTVGLCYIALGMGSLTSTLTMGHVVDWNFRRTAKQLGMVITKRKQQDLGEFPIERVRLQVVVPGHIIGLLAIILFGWTIKFRTHLAGPEIALFFIGFGVSTSFNLTNTLLIDLHRDKPATATAAVNFVRCLMSAGGAAAIIPMCKAMNPGWAFTFIALIYVVWIGVVFLIMKNGLKWRQEATAKKAMKERENEKADEQTADQAREEAEDGASSRHSRDLEEGDIQQRSLEEKGKR